MRAQVSKLKLGPRPRFSEHPPHRLAQPSSTSRSMRQTDATACRPPPPPPEASDHTHSTPPPLLLFNRTLQSTRYPQTRGGGGWYVKFWGRLGPSVKSAPSNFGRQLPTSPIKFSFQDRSRAGPGWAVSVTCVGAALQLSPGCRICRTCRTYVGPVGPPSDHTVGPPLDHRRNVHLTGMKISCLEHHR